VLISYLCCLQCNAFSNLKGEENKKSCCTCAKVNSQFQAGLSPAFRLSLFHDMSFAYLLFTIVGCYAYLLVAD
jgi:hypothetical protein